MTPACSFALARLAAPSRSAVGAPAPRRESPLPLRELGRLAGAVQAGLLALLRARIAGEKARLAQDRPVLGVDFEQRSRDRMTDRAELARFPAPGDLDHRVEPAGGVRDPEWLERRLGVAVAAQVILQPPPVCDDRAPARDQPDPGDAPPS